MKDPLHFLETRRVSITSTVGVEAMLATAAVDATVEVLPTPLLPKHYNKTYYVLEYLIHANNNCNDCRGKPPNIDPTYGITDTWATKNYIKVDTHVK